MLWTVVKEAAGNWSSHKDSRQGAVLAYYSVFSLGPIIVIANPLLDSFSVGRPSAGR
jgi:membrane protein